MKINDKQNKKDIKTLSFTLPVSLFNKISEYSTQTGIAKAVIIKLAINEFFEKRKN